MPEYSDYVETRTEADTLDGSEIIALSQDGGSRRVSLQRVIDEVGSGEDHFRGYYASLAALQAAVPAANDGDYAYVDAGPGNDSTNYIWDTDDDDWVLASSTPTSPWDETTAGTVERSTTAEAQNIVTRTAAGSSNASNSDARTTSEKGLVEMLLSFLGAAWTWALQQTFTTAPRFSSTTASQFLKVDSNKDLVSVPSASQSDMITGTDDVEPATSLSVESKRSIKLVSFSNSATGSSTIDCGSKQEVTVFYNTTVTGAITIALSNDSNLEILNIVIPITGANIAITTPSTTRMTRYNEVSSGDGWYQSTKILQVSSIGTADTHELSFKKVSSGPTFNLQYDGPYRA